MADFSTPAATIAKQKAHGFLHVLEVGAIDDGAAPALRADQLRTRQNGKMCRHGVVRHIKLTCYLTRGQPVGFVAHQQAECRQPLVLSECRETAYRLLCIHMSKNIDIFRFKQLPPAGLAIQASIFAALDRAVANCATSSASLYTAKDARAVPVRPKRLCSGIVQ